MGSLEHVPFVELCPCLQEQFPVLLRKRGLAMMFFLSLDIFDQVINVALRAGERGVALLPVRKSLEYGVFFNPEGRAGLDLLEEIRQAKRWDASC